MCCRYLTCACMPMVRVPMSLTEPQAAFLRAQAASLGISVQDLIRRIIDNTRLPATPNPAPKESNS